MGRLSQGIAALFILLLPFPGFAADRLSVVFINPGDTSGFWGEVARVMHHASDSLDIDLEILNAGRDHTRMAQHARSVSDRAERPDFAIIVNELGQGPKLIEPLARADIPVYFLLNKLSDQQKSDVAETLGHPPTLVGSAVPTNYDAGFEMLIELVAHAAPTKTDVAVLAILGDDVTPAALEREHGLRSAAATLDHVDIIRAFSVRWDPEVTFDRVRTALELIHFDAIWAANDDLALAAHRALEGCQRPRCSDIPIAGLNWSAAGLAAVSNGDLVLTHGGHFLAGAYALAALHNIARHGEPPRDISLQMSDINEGNVAHFAARIAEDWGAWDYRGLAQSLRSGAQQFDPAQILGLGRAPQG